MLTFVEDLQSHACLRDVHCAEYKNRNKKGDDVSLIGKNMNTLLLKSKKIATFKSQLLTEHKEVMLSK